MESGLSGWIPVILTGIQFVRLDSSYSDWIPVIQDGQLTITPNGESNFDYSQCAYKINLCQARIELETSQ